MDRYIMKHEETRPALFNPPQSLTTATTTLAPLPTPPNSTQEQYLKTPRMASLSYSPALTAVRPYNPGARRSPSPSDAILFKHPPQSHRSASHDGHLSRSANNSNRSFSIPPQQAFTTWSSPATTPRTSTKHQRFPSVFSDDNNTTSLAQSSSPPRMASRLVSKKRPRPDDLDEEQEAHTLFHHLSTPSKRIRKDSGGDDGVQSADPILFPSEPYEYTEEDLFNEDRICHPHILLRATKDKRLRDLIKSKRGISPPSGEDIEVIQEYMSYNAALYSEVASRIADIEASIKADRAARHAAIVKKPRTHKPIKKPVQMKLDNDEHRPKTPSSHARKRSTITAQSPGVNTQHKSTRAPPSKPALSKNPNHWPDFSPQVLDEPELRRLAETFPVLGREIKDYSMEPFYDQLHPTEQVLVGRCACPPEKYIANMRSVFVGFLKSLLASKGKYSGAATSRWNKTAAQTCTSMDVNKTSSLFDNFWNKAGLFEEKYYQKYIDNPELAKFPEFDTLGNPINKS